MEWLKRGWGRQGEGIGGPLEQSPESVGSSLLTALSSLPRLASRDDQAQVCLPPPPTFLDPRYILHFFNMQ